MSWINAVEVYYRTERDHGRAAADGVARSLRQVLELELPGQARMIEVARLKAAYPDRARRLLRDRHRRGARPDPPHRRP